MNIPSIPNIADEPRNETLLRLAAEYIRTYCKDPLKPIADDEYEDGSDGETLIRDLDNEAEELRKTREKRGKGMNIHGTLIQAGGDKDPTITISTTRHELQRCPSIPFFQTCEVIITPTKI